MLFLSSFTTYLFPFHSRYFLAYPQLFEREEMPFTFAVSELTKSTLNGSLDIRMNIQTSRISQATNSYDTT